MALSIEGQRLDPVMGYNFLVTLIETADPVVGGFTTALGALQSAAVGGFSECSGIEMRLEVEERPEGGNANSVRKFPTRVSWSNVRLKRGVAVSDDLYNWHVGFAEGRGRRRDGLVILQNDLKVAVRVWYFRRGLPVRWVGPTLDATRGAVAIEEIEIAHEGLRAFGLSQALSAPTGVSF